MIKSKSTEFEFKVEQVKEIKELTQFLEKKCKDFLKRIEQNGIDEDFSINHDILETALKIHTKSALLGYIKNFGLELDKFNDVVVSEEQPSKEENKDVEE